METTKAIEHISNASFSAFSMEGSLWMIWILIGIVVLWFDLIRKTHLGLLSIAAFITVFASFFVAPEVQILVFGFASLVLTVAEHAHREHHKKLKYSFIH